MKVYLAYADDYDRHASWELVGVYASHESATAASLTAQEKALERVPKQLRHPDQRLNPIVEEHDVLP